MSKVAEKAKTVSGTHLLEKCNGKFELNQKVADGRTAYRCDGCGAFAWITKDGKPQIEKEVKPE